MPNTIGTTSSPASEARFPRRLIVFAVIIFGTFALVAKFFPNGWHWLILIGFYGYWTPQIMHNVEQGTARRGLQKRFIIGQTLCRLFVPLYVWACPYNFFFVEPNRWVFALAGYSIAQAGVLIGQDLLGPRFFLPSRFFRAEQRYDYHPTSINANVMAANANMTCNICFERINIGTDGGGVDTTVDGLGHAFNRRAVMVPPCNHVAHTECLETWLGIKSECPTCRRPLPPI